MQPKSTVVNLPVYKPGKSAEDIKREYGLDYVVKLASNENPYGSSQKVKEAILREIENTNLYPDGAAFQLTQAIAKHFGVDENQVIMGAGSDEIIMMLCRAYLVQGDETIMADQTFPQYKHNAVVEGAVIVEVPMVEATHDLKAMLAAVTERTKIVWICNPNNPTGTIVSHEEVESFMEQVSSDVIVVLDEAYCEYVTDESFPDAFALMKKYRNLITLRTFSKIHGLASLRIGYGIGHPDVIRTINQVREPFNTTRFAQAAAQASLEDTEFIQFCKQNNAQSLAYLRSEFNRLGLSSFPAHGNFIMVDAGMPATEMFEKLLHKGFITRPGHQKYPNHIRITAGLPEHNEKLVAAVAEIIEQAKVTL